MEYEIINGIKFWLVPPDAEIFRSKPNFRHRLKLSLATTTIGRRLIDDTLLTIGDPERQSGLYILGQPRTGKSWLMVNIIIQDIQNRHGIFFLDPHGDAINDLISRTAQPVILLDPEEQEYTFGINLLECPDIDTYLSVQI